MRVQSFSFNFASESPGPVQVTTSPNPGHSAPPEHVGLGVGTQVCLAAARAVFNWPASRNSVESSPVSTGRGHRSGIGLHGFQHGGLIIDGGGNTGTGIPPLLARFLSRRTGRS